MIPGRTIKPLFQPQHMAIDALLNHELSPPNSYVLEGNMMSRVAWPTSAARLHDLPGQVLGYFVHPWIILK